MKILLAAINSRYNHTNLAIRSIARYAESHLVQKGGADKDTEKDKDAESRTIRALNVADADLCTIEIAEYTINQNKGDILRGIYQQAADAILFSVYIWNVEMTLQIIGELKKILPNIIIGVGGPEVSYRSGEILEKNKNIDFVMCGEGEKTVLELIENRFQNLSSIPGIMERNSCYTERLSFPNLDEFPFPYTDKELTDCADTKIFYYESSRGCPFKCSYCLSSIDKSVRYRSLDLVFADLKKFLNVGCGNDVGYENDVGPENNAGLGNDARRGNDAGPGNNIDYEKKGVKLVKFVDRTFNLDENRTIAIWEFLRKNHNGKTMFHFEIEAHTLTQKMLDCIKDFPSGIVQFEIGVQSTNPITLKEIGRTADFELIKRNVMQIPSTIHKHLDLIAGLPHEDLSSFGKSFDDVISLKPDMLQLGFLKILSGTKMADYAEKKDISTKCSTVNSYQFLSTPPYEVLASDSMSYEDLLFLKDLEQLLDIYYNSGNFSKTIEFLFSLKNFSFFYFFSVLIKYFKSQLIFENAHKEIEYFSFLWNFLGDDHLDDEQTKNLHRNLFTHLFTTEEKLVLKETLRFDFISAQKTSSFPAWYKHRYDKDEHRTAINLHTEVKSHRESYAHSEYEVFDFDMKTFCKAETKYLFLYDSVKGKTHERKFIKL